MTPPKNRGPAPSGKGGASARAASRGSAARGTGKGAPRRAGAPRRQGAPSKGRRQRGSPAPPARASRRPRRSGRDRPARRRPRPRRRPAPEAARGGRRRLAAGLREPHHGRAASRSTARSSPSSACGSAPTQTVHVDGVRVQLDESRVYLAFNKPLGVVTSMSDELGRVDIGDFVGEPQGAALPRRPARRRHRGPAHPHQRRRPRAPAAAPALRRAQDLPRPDPRAGAARPRQAAARGRRARGRPACRSTPSGSSTPRRARRSSRSCSTRAASTSCAGCSTRSATRCITLVRTAGRPDPPRRHQARASGATSRARRSAPSTGRGGAVTRVHIVGTGLIGTSLGLALSRLGDDVTLEDISPDRTRPWPATSVPGGCPTARRARPRRRRDPARRHGGRASPTRCARWPGRRRHRRRVGQGRRPRRAARPTGADLARYCGSHPMAGRERSGAVVRPRTTCSTGGPGCSRPTAETDPAVDRARRPRWPARPVPRSAR